MIYRISIGYDHEVSNHFAEISLRSNNGDISSFKINDLSEYLLYDDFSASYISQCKLIIDTDNVYLSLDPYDELSTKIDKDNDCFWFKGSNLVQL